MIKSEIARFFFFNFFDFFDLLDLFEWIFDFDRDFKKFQQQFQRI